MKNLVFLNTCTLTFMALCMTLNVSCSEGSHSSSGAAGSPNTPVGGSLADGTTDGNGGNGVNGKIYESYIVDPTSLPAFKNVIQKKLDIMMNISKQKDGKEMPKESLEIYRRLFLTKRWYIAPVSLKSLNKKTIGVEFSQENTEQLALQTTEEVWINQQTFEKMSEVDQATLLVHEFAMTAYMFLQQGDRDYCKFANGASCDLIEDNTPKKEKLDQTDYQKIRAATSSFMNINEQSTHEQLEKEFQKYWKRGNEEDQTIYTSASNNEYASINRYSIMSLLKSFSVAGDLNGPCKIGKTQKQCSVQVTQAGTERLAISITDTTTKEVIRSFEIKVSEDRYVKKLKKDSNQETYFAIGISSEIPNDLKDGAITNSIQLMVYDWNGEPSATSSFVGISFPQTVWSITKGVRSSDNQPCEEGVGSTPSDRTIKLGNTSELYGEGKSSVGNCK